MHCMKKTFTIITNTNVTLSSFSELWLPQPKSTIWDPTWPRTTWTCCSKCYSTNVKLKLKSVSISSTSCCIAIGHDSAKSIIPHSFVLAKFDESGPTEDMNWKIRILCTSLAAAKIQIECIGSIEMGRGWCMHYVHIIFKEKIKPKTLVPGA
jgi:hypothetical protein